jgi:hypothetical protein
VYSEPVLLHQLKIWRRLFPRVQPTHGQPPNNLIQTSVVDPDPILMFLGLMDPDPSIIKQKQYEKS